MVSSNSKITIVGCGLLGSMLAPALASFITSLAFATDIVLIDNDVVEKRNSPSNLMVPSTLTDKKVDVVASTYVAADLKVTRRKDRLTKNNTWMLDGSTVIIGALDNVETRLLIADYAIENGVPYLDLGLSFTGGIVTWTSGETRTMPFLGKADYQVDAEKKPACELIGTRIYSAIVCECAVQSLFIYLSQHDPLSVVPSHISRLAQNGDMINWTVLMDGQKIQTISQFVGNDKGG